MDNKTAKVLSEVSVAVGQDVYKDTAKSTLKSTGEVLSLVPKTINAALLPLRKWIASQEYNIAETEKLLAIKLQNVSPEQISAPEAYIGVPALQYISYCMDSEELRDMYANLLAKSMNEVTRNGAHPSFVEIIKQLCPDEAKLLKVMGSYVPTISIRYQNEEGSGVEILRNFSDIADKAMCEHPNNISQYIDNLERLGIIETKYLSSLTDKSVYEPLKKHNIVKSIEAKYTSEVLARLSSTLGGQVSIEYEEGFYSITDYGCVFRSICIESLKG